MKMDNPLVVNDIAAGGLFRLKAQIRIQVHTYMSYSIE